MLLFKDRIQAAFNEENHRRKAEEAPRLTKTDLWKAAGMTSAAATFWFDGSNGADMDTCMKIAPLMRVNAKWLFDGTKPKNIDPPPSVADDHTPIRFVDAKASAGKGKLVFSDDIAKTLMFRRDWLAKNDASPEDTLAFHVDGASMTDLHIVDGAVVLANQKKTDPISKKVYVLWLNGQLYVKQLVKQKGVWYARSHNANQADDYPDIQIEPDDRIVGKVFWCGFGL
ncbi:Peptidase S24/S26A/S26B/S26C domain-containing protein [Bordetella tumbae]|uniref:S24 family peptidase n=1 Tax=Bordetella tumbae TaxID=1649139 RepID=UPI0039EE5A7F